MLQASSRLVTKSQLHIAIKRELREEERRKCDQVTGDAEHSGKITTHSKERSPHIPSNQMSTSYK